MDVCGGISQSISQTGYDLPIKTKLLFIWFGAREEIFYYYKFRNLSLFSCPGTYQFRSKLENLLNRFAPLFGLIALQHL